RHEGVRTEVFGFGSSTAEELVEAADSFVDMSENEGRYLL
ncbi:NYN domain-containing protein, partial [Halobacteriales archaeon QS_1_68_44]